MDIILVSGRGNKTFNLQIKSGLLISVVVIFTVILALFVYNIIAFMTTDVDYAALKKLKAENKIVRQELTKMENEVTDLNVLLDSLELYDEKLRTYASLKPINKDIRNMGIGGYTPNYDAGNLSEEVSKNLENLSQTLDDLLARTNLQKESYESILAQLEEKNYLQDHTPSIIPVQGWLIRDYGIHKDPFTGLMRMHEGIDIAAPIGTPIVAPAHGTVKFAGARSGFGLTVEIDHGYGFSTRYAHCQRIKAALDQKVKRGEVIAYVGNTGKSTGPHLHYEVHVSQTPVDPVDYIMYAPFFTD